MRRWTSNSPGARAIQLPPYPQGCRPCGHLGHLHRPKVPRIQTPVRLTRHKDVAFPDRETALHMREAIPPGLRVDTPVVFVADDESPIPDTGCLPGHRRDRLEEWRP